MPKVPLETLLAQLPASLKESLVVKTTNGTEIAVQCILWHDTDYLVVRGRVAGTADYGQAYFIPMEKVEFLCVQKPVKDDEMTKILSKILKENTGPAVSPLLAEEMRERLKALGVSRQPSIGQEKA